MQNRNISLQNDDKGNKCSEDKCSEDKDQKKEEKKTGPDGKRQKESRWAEAKGGSKTGMVGAAVFSKLVQDGCKTFMLHLQPDGTIHEEEEWKKAELAKQAEWKKVNLSHQN